MKLVAMSFRAGATRVDVLVCIALEEEFAIARSVFARSTGVETEAPLDLLNGPSLFGGQQPRALAR
jgi:hypothetical protein